MILADRDIETRLDEDLKIDPQDDPREQIQPASVDLTLSHAFIQDGDEYGTDSWTLTPGEFVLGSTVETVGVPDDLVASVEGRSSWGRKGLTIHSTAGWVDPGFVGDITLEISNEGNEPVTIEAGDRICQIVFHTLHSSARRPYGHEDRNSKYQEQTGPVESRMEADDD